jgi:hypothetical protein
MSGTADISAGEGGFQGFGRRYPSEREAIIGLIDILRVEEGAAGLAIGSWVKVCRTPLLRGGLAMIAERESFHGRVFGRRMTDLGAEWRATINPERGAEYQACLADPDVADTVKLARLVDTIGDTEEVIAPVVDFALRITEDMETREALRLYCEDEISTGRWLCEACARLGVAPAPTTARAQAARAEAA